MRLQEEKHVGKAWEPSKWQEPLFPRRSTVTDLHGWDIKLRNYFDEFVCLCLIYGIGNVGFEMFPLYVIGDDLFLWKHKKKKRETKQNWLPETDPETQKLLVAPTTYRIKANFKIITLIFLLYLLSYFPEEIKHFSLFEAVLEAST